MRKYIAIIIASLALFTGQAHAQRCLPKMQGIEGQDLNIFSLVQRNQKGLVVVVNKWDLIEDKTAKVMKGYEDAPEDFALCELVCSSKMELERIVREGLDMLRREMC